jgi:hypothetical protein
MTATILQIPHLNSTSMYIDFDSRSEERRLTQVTQRVSFHHQDHRRGERHTTSYPGFHCASRFERWDNPGEDARRLH